MILNGKLIQLLKEHTQLRNQKMDLDFAFAKWAAALLAEVKSDPRFIMFCTEQCKMERAEAESALHSALAYKNAPDLATWKALGGRRAVLALERLAKKKDQIAAIGQAKVEKRKLDAVITDRIAKGAAENPALVADRARSSSCREDRSFAAPGTTPAARKREMSDLETLASFISENRAKLGRLPDDVGVIVRMYAGR